jgi:ADP-heptose:LPS heptosyltransferase
MMCQKAGVTGTVSIRPYLFLKDAERTRGQLSKNQIAIQSSTRSAKTPLRNKEWLPERFQSVVNAFSGRFQFIQLGSPADPRLDNVIDLRGKTTLRQAAAVISRSRLFVGLASGLMHVARAVDRPAAIVYGGRERPEISGYICNANVTTKAPCSPCWQRNHCNHNHICMTDIAPDRVIDAVEKILGDSEGSLAVEQIRL